jgi:hypothetical protein
MRSHRVEIQEPPMTTHNEIETLTALLICAASETGEADNLVLPPWALNESGDPNFTAIVSAGRQLLQSRNGVDEYATVPAMAPADTEYARAVNSVGEMIDKAYSASKLTGVVMAFGIHCASGHPVIEATQYALQECEIE